MSHPALLNFLLHLKTVGLLTIELKDLEDITIMPAPMSNNATTSIPFACTLYRIGLEPSVSASLTWTSFTSFHSHSESEYSKAWHNSLTSSSVSCGAGESWSSSLSKKASLMLMCLLSANLQSYLPSFFDVLVPFLVPALLLLVFLILRNIMWTSTVVTFQTSSIFVVFMVIMLVQLVMLLSAYLLLVLG